MDKYEYKVRVEEIKQRINEQKYAQAAEIADTIDWRRVKSVMMLCTISDVYKANRRYEDAKNLLLLAYDRRPGGRSICYSLCELCVKTEDFVQAVEFYKEFVQVAPKDAGRYILQYKLYEAQDVSLEERIQVLEELKKREYREKWAYELAYLYHRVGLATRCVEECDELILWFGEGKYVIKAMELKMLHQPLTASQQQKYDARFEAVKQTAEPQTNQNPVDNSQSEYLDEGDNEEAPVSSVPVSQDTKVFGAVEEPEDNLGDTKIYNPEMVMQALGEIKTNVDIDNIQVKTMDVGQYNTMNLQAELAEGLKEIFNEEEQKDSQDEITKAIVAPMLETDTESLDFPELDEDFSDDDIDDGLETIEDSEVFFGETGEIVMDNGDVEADFEVPNENQTASIVMNQIRNGEEIEGFEEPKQVEPPKEFANVLSQESDGQISLVMPEKSNIEKQITGQINLEEIMREWERMKKESEEKRAEEVRQHVLEHTGTMFTEFEASVRDGLLEKIEAESSTPDNIDELVVKAMAEGTDILDDSDEADEIDEIQEIEEEIGEQIEEELEETQEEIQEEFDEDLDEELDEELDIDSQIDEEFVEEVMEAVDEEAAEEVEEAVTEEAIEEVAEAVAEEAVEEVTETVAEEAVEEVKETIVEQAVEEVTETVAEQAVEKVAETIAAQTVEEVAEAVAEQAVEEVTEAVAEEAVEEVTETVAEQAIEEVTEVVAEQAVAEQAATEVIEAVAEQVTIQDIAENHMDATEAESISDNDDYMDAESGDIDAQQDGITKRNLSREEKELFAPFVQSKKSREQLIKVLDGISLAPYTGNVIITGEEGIDTFSLAKNIIREIQVSDNNFSGKVAKISGEALNKKSVDSILTDLNNGALIVEKASEIEAYVASALYRALQQEDRGVIIVLIDNKKEMNNFLKANSFLNEPFNTRMDVEALSNDALAEFGRQYAYKKEFSIDEMGILALHTRIEALQTSDHVANVVDVKKIVDEAINRSSKKSVGHFIDVLLARRYDDEDMIVLGEKDFS